jgi:hypothetical protein
MWTKRGVQVQFTADILRPSGFEFRRQLSRFFTTKGFQSLFPDEFLPLIRPLSTSDLATYRNYATVCHFESLIPSPPGWHIFGRY